MDNLTEKQKLKVLFFASDPSDESRLHLGKELQSIRTKLKDNEDFEIKDHLASTANDIMNEIMIYKPQIVHFSGHGTAEGQLKFEDELGNAKSIPPEALATLFSLTKDFIKCVIVNTCYAEKQAKAIANYIPIVIGTKSEISDDTAISFSSGFYTALNPELSIESIEKAFNLGKIAIQFSENPGEHITPIIIYGTSNVRFAAEVDSAFSFIINPKGKAVNTLIYGLKLKGSKMGLSNKIVQDVIEEKIANLNVHNINLQEYEKNLKEILRDEYPLSTSSVGALSYLQSGLNLSNEDVKLIHDRILSDTNLDGHFSWYDRGLGQFGLGNNELSIDYFTKAIEKNNEYSAAYAQRGLCHSREKDYEGAVTDFSKAIEINKNWEISSNLSLTLFDRGFAYLELGQNDKNFIEKGIEDYKNVIELNPKESAAYFNVAIGYEKLNDFKSAAKWFIEALEQGYDNRTAVYSGIIKCYSELNENKKQAEWLKKYNEEQDVSNSLN